MNSRPVGVRIASLLALAPIAVSLSPAAASAQAPPVQPAPHVNEPIAVTQDVAKPSIGNGAIAWAVLDHPFDNAPGTTIWTLRDGQPMRVVRLAQLRAWRLEAGTDATGKPVAIVSALPQAGTPTPFHLVRLDDGGVQRLRLGPQARLASDVAIDAGRVLYTTSSRSRTAGARSSLWSAQLDAGGLIQRKRLRHSRRGVTFVTVRADRSRIAVTGYDPMPPKSAGLAAYLPLYAGTARGIWRKVGNGGELEGGTLDAEAAGFTRHGRHVIVTKASGAHESFSVKRVSLRSGATKQQLGGIGVPEIAAAYDPASRRLLLSSFLPAGGYQLGWSRVLG